MTSAPVAAIDCGTNSIRLLIAHREGERVVDDYRTMRIVRLGEGVDETGRLSSAAIERTVTAAADYARICRERGVRRIRFVATSATRDADNRDDFTTQIEAAVGVTPRVLPGAEEAALSYLGATSRLRSLAYPAVVVDIGGGSTEFIAAPTAGDPGRVRARSTNMGSVRAAEKFPAFEAGGLAGERERARAAHWVEGVLDEVEQVVDWPATRTLVGVAGTVTTIAAHALGLAEYDEERLHDARFTPEHMVDSCNQMLAMPVAERAELGFMPTGREDVIGAGALIWRAIVERFASATGQESGLSVVVSEYDILDGVARQLLDEEAGR